MDARTGALRVVAVTVGLAGRVSLWLCNGCAAQPGLPAPVDVRPLGRETVYTFDTNGDRQPDFWQYQGPDGRKQAIAYARDERGQPGERIDLDALAPTDCPHFVIALDGVPFDVVDQLYREGYFRFFYPPARVICCFPSMTDLALAELFHADRCVAYEALHFDRQTNRLTDGNATYLSGQNSPWVGLMSYRCSFWWDANAYLSPQAVFDHELRGILHAFRAVQEGHAYTYTVGTAGLGTRGGRSAIEEYLRTLDRVCERIIFERRGRVRITLTADHGHNLVENRRVSFRDALKAGGYRPTKSLRGPRDVVAIAYGLVTYAAFYTNDPAGVARCLIPHEDVEFACYPDRDAIVVCDRRGDARITRGSDGFIYDSGPGDPLKLAAIVARLTEAGAVSPDGSIDGAALFEATVEHYYPDPLARLWNAFHGLVERPPDVIANLRDGACHGSRLFAAAIGKVTSTHGSLNRMNSTAFALTTLGELPAALRSADLLPALERLRTR